ncbi:MAG: class I SAM-dependent methyltransferase [Actinobacteria bacterium]|nr:class I SAM-dependent methyltransferase [Actinomycetota bacterium]
MKFENKISRWNREIKENKRSLSSGVMNKAGHVIRKMTGTSLWATKSFEIWLLIQNILFLVKPQKILEFGSGRSTNYLSEYAYKNDAELISIEHTLYYYFTFLEGLKFSFLNPEYLKYVPLKSGWYKISKLERFLSSCNDIDLFFLDGPNNPYFEKRDPEIFYKYIFPKLGKIKIILVDDTQIKPVDNLADEISLRCKLIRYDVSYMAGRTENKMAVLLDPNSNKLLDDLPDYLKEMLYEKIDS